MIDKLNQGKKPAKPIIASAFTIKPAFRTAVTIIPMLCIALFAPTSFSQTKQTKGSFEDVFRQLDEILPTPNTYRTASGAPGNDYWQQQADYVIDATLDENNKRISASERITYSNNSPDTLSFIWIQLDQNRFRKDSIGQTTGSTGSDRISFASMRLEQHTAERQYGFEIQRVALRNGTALDYTINDTMMRIDLESPLRNGQSVTFDIDWEHNIVFQEVTGGRGGYEHFPNTDTYQFALSQWYPRVAAYTDYNGWVNKQFIGRGEFTLEFGDFDVSLTVPADHIVASTGVLQNPAQVLTTEQRERLNQARESDTPVFIVTPEEAEANQAEGSDDMVTWRFEAENVRDFAWASSRKYIWDALTHVQEGAEHEEVLAMSFYPPEAEPLWSQYSTHSVAHTMDVYSKFSFDYPYPVAISVNAWESGGMEYPMITFNGYRPVEDEDTGERTYSRRAKYGLISVVIHEIGHIYFPMTVNSDERQWTWMDEGLNTFLQFLSEREWEDDYPSRRGDPKNIVDYMLSENQVPIMTNSESILQFGNNAYAKPATALVVLRETVMGRALFDFAFKQYSERWMFKRPTPSDFFRTLEDASAVDLDWFFRGWFYSTDHVDIALNDVREYKVSTQDPEIEFPLDSEEADEDPESLTQVRNEDIETRVERYPELNDFYNENDEFTVSNKDRNDYTSFTEGLEDWEKEVLDKAIADGSLIYFLDFENIGGLVMPIPLQIDYVDGSSESKMIPAEIWRYDSHSVTHTLITTKEIASVEVDPSQQIADADTANNKLPREIQRSRIELYKSDNKQRDLMADMLVDLKSDETGDDPEGSADLPLEASED
ncbi:MAG: M1 family metallopeptidase [Gammaproteobacteria bacterium]|jgi:predicted secreted protein|nr:M1 family metallopeptidase [Gammaproteobacteria bacterium]